MLRPITTLFLLMSLDGKISTGYGNQRDVDKDFPNIPGVAEGLQQYYNIEQTTDLWSINSGRVLSKVGINTAKTPQKTPVSFVVIDSSHLNVKGVQNMCAKSDNLVIVTTNPNHPALSINNAKNLYVLQQNKLNLRNMLEFIGNKYGCKTATIQTGETINGLFLREKLIDRLNIVVAPIIIGGKETPSLIGGKSIVTTKDLAGVGVLSLIKCNVLKNSYVQLLYKVINSK